MRDELNQIIAGIGDSPTANLIQAALFHLRTSQSTSGTPQKAEFIHKEAEVRLLKDFAQKFNCWYDSVDEQNYIGEGAEQRVFSFAVSRW
ncbi:hypothetical protein [Runella slithyformis]|uniref:Uncharacterized protein n=1 Tax=Runella slithyformis (strain ATCC 29530 / DSM 19594 / LMG 11500 / NCIMB 11436 / LSU 4) TaxID=761193 RepID=A0A7U3ZGJ9_RUNSL|nr:hypothetical protein [Runella slithyformis]AEI46817.1 hypothetical protein Runsl_0365 [Runella slithyformis DSM 19594]